MTLYPILTAPCFRAAAWGGSMLRDAFLKEAPEQTGKSFEVSAEPDCECSVRNGAHAGVTLSHMINLWGESLTGAAEGLTLQLKLIDAGEQIEFGPGGDAAWVVLNCEPGTKLMAGAGWVDARPGDVYHISAGASRGLGAGVQVCELAHAGESANAAAASGRLRGVTSLCKGGSRTYYISDAHLELCRLNVSGSMPVSDGRMLLLMPLGPCALRWGEEALKLMPFDSAIVPAGLADVRVESDDCKLLMASLPRQDALRSELGYRAESVSGLA